MGIYFMCGKEHELSRTYGCKAKTNVAAAEKLSCDPGEEKDPAQAIGQVLLHQPALAGALLVLVMVHQDKLRMVLLVINLPLFQWRGVRHAALQ